MTGAAGGPAAAGGSPNVSLEEAAELPQATALAEAFVHLAETLVADYDVVDLMDRLIESSVALLDVTAAGILLLDQQRELQVVASSSEETRLLELFQLQHDNGPCLDCIATGEPVHVDHLDDQGPWPQFTQAAGGFGYTAVHAVPMRYDGEVIGGLNLFGSSGLGAHGQRIAQALADVATIGLLQQRTTQRAALLAEQLQTALDSRVAIEQAKGVLAQLGRLDMDAAYKALRRYARNHNLKLSLVAEQVVDGRLPADTLLGTGS